MQVFDQVYVATAGGPQFKTETAVQYIYSRGFTAPYELGYASALSSVLFIIVATIAISTNVHVTERKTNEIGGKPVWHQKARLQLL